MQHPKYSRVGYYGCYRGTRIKKLPPQIRDRRVMDFCLIGNEIIPILIRSAIRFDSNYDLHRLKICLPKSVAHAKNFTIGDRRVHFILQHSFITYTGCRYFIPLVEGGGNINQVFALDKCL